MKSFHVQLQGRLADVPAHPSPGWKRLLDLVVGSLCLLLLAPVLILLAVMVKLDSPGPIFYRQQRVGRYAIPFTMLKFRSMFHGSDDLNHREAAAVWFSGTPVSGGYKSASDPRVTRVGRFLRRTSLDELPQLFNVLRGTMSLVGPRPAIAYELEHYEPWYFERLSVRPGMTGLWQVLGRDRLPASEMMALDRRYVQRCSLWLDLSILVQTLPALLGLAPKERLT